MAKDVSFASFNLYNFQYRGLRARGELISDQAYWEKVHWVREKLLEIDADVVALQELWDKRCLEDVLDDPRLADYRPYYIADEWYDIAVAAIVRRPWQVRHKHTIKDFPFSQLTKIDEADGLDDELEVNITRFSRTVLRLKLEYPGSRSTPHIMVFCAHLKAKLPSTIRRGVPRQQRDAVGTAISTIRRTAEAVALRWFLNEHMRGPDATPTVVLGDLNDDPRSNTIAILSEEPTMTTASRGTQGGLYSSLLLQQLKSFRDVYYTHEFKSRRDAIDHIFVSREFFEHAQGRKWKLKDLRIWNDHIHAKHRHTSDHGIICAKFT